MRLTAPIGIRVSWASWGLGSLTSILQSSRRGGPNSGVDGSDSANPGGRGGGHFHASWGSAAVSLSPGCTFRVRSLLLMLRRACGGHLDFLGFIQECSQCPGGLGCCGFIVCRLEKRDLQDILFLKLHQVHHAPLQVSGHVTQHAGRSPRLLSSVL